MSTRQRRKNERPYSASTGTHTKCMRIVAIAAVSTFRRHGGSGITSSVVCATSTSASPSRAPFRAGEIRNFFRHRCGFDSSHEPCSDVSTLVNDGGDDDDDHHDDNHAAAAIWAYEGTLTDPATGRVVAEVEGLELVRPLSAMTSSVASRTSGLRRLGGLSVTNLLRRACDDDEGTSSPAGDDASDNEWDSAVTFLSRKLFCYRRPGYSTTADEVDGSILSDPSGTLLTSIRLRPDGPIRRLSLNESVAVYDSAVTYISRNDGREMVVHSERPDGTYAMGSARSVLGSSSGRKKGDAAASVGDSFDFAVHTRQGGSSPPFLPPLLKSLGLNSKGDEVVVAPPRAKFLQFGKGDGLGDGSEKKYGAVQETYSYSFGGAKDSIESDPRSNVSNGRRGLLGMFGRGSKSNDVSETTATETPPPCVSYTRYGESPPWHSPGRMCTLELRGTRISAPSVDDKTRKTGHSLPPLALWVASNYVPSFWFGWPVERLRKEDGRASELDAVRMFRGRDVAIPLEIKGGNEECTSRAGRFLALARSCSRRMSDAVILDEIQP